MQTCFENTYKCHIATKFKNSYVYAQCIYALQERTCMQLNANESATCMQLQIHNIFTVTLSLINKLLHSDLKLCRTVLFHIHETTSTKYF